MKLADCARIVREYPLNSGRSEIWISKKDGSRSFRGVFVGLGASRELLTLLEHAPDRIPPDTEEGQLAFIRLNPCIGNVTILELRDISGISYSAEVIILDMII